jgi:hypothetical protein
VSGFLTRMAARAAGGPTGATPQVPARFAPASSSDGPAPPAGPDLRPSAGPADVQRRTRSDAPAAAVGEPTSSARIERRPAASGQAADPPDPPGPTPVRRSAPVARPVAGPASSAEEAGRSELPADTAAIAEPRLLAAVPPPAAPLVVALPVPEPRLASADSPAAAESPRGPDVVHVSIGRIDVRAPAPPATPPAPRQVRSAEPEPLALDAYLRGKREAR